MKIAIVRSVTNLLLLMFFYFTAGVGLAIAEPSIEKISGPYTHKNLSVYLIHGPDTLDTRDVMTLDEGLKLGKVRVNETGQVNQLTVDNLSSDKRLLLQAGEIVKGGRQDRVIGTDTMIEPAKKNVQVSVFCVESGRWQQRGAEKADNFSSSENIVAAKEIKIAARKSKDQGKVWESVAKSQNELSDNVGMKVNDPRSASSMQLALESKAVVENTADYEKALSKLSDERDVIGYAFAINGEINSAESYASHDLFSRSWVRLLKASATEALAEKGKPAGSAPGIDAIRDFISQQDKKLLDRKQLESASIEESESDTAVQYDTREIGSGKSFKRSILKK